MPKETQPSTPSLEKLCPSQRMQHKLTFKPAVLPEEASRHNVLEKIPLLSGFVRQADRANSALDKIVGTSGNLSDTIETAKQGLSVASIAMHAVDFLRIPIIYLSSILAGEKPPITVSNNAKWLYSAVLLGLAATALALPVVAPIIALSAASFTFAVALFTMGKVISQNNQVRKSLKVIESDIAREAEALNHLHDEAAKIEKQLNESLITSNDAQASILRAQLDDVTKRFDLLFETKKVPLQTLYDKKFEQEQKLQKAGTAAVMNKGISVALAAMAVTGLALSLFFPPIGAGILAASAILSAVYLVSRVGFPFIKRLFTSTSSKKESAETSGKPEEHLDLGSKSTLSNTSGVSLEAESRATDSTGKTMRLLSGDKNPTQALQKLVFNSQQLYQIHANLIAIVSRQDTPALLRLFAQLSSHVQSTSPHSTTDDVRELFNTLEEMDPPLSLSSLMPLMKDSASAVQTCLAEQEKNDLFSCSPLITFLHEQGVELKVIAPEHEEEQQKTTPRPMPG